MPLVTLATCNLNQWALDFDGNLERVKESIIQAKKMGCRYRLGPELEICGYGCEDHFYEPDTYIHCEEVLATLLKSDLTNGIVCDLGMPVLHRDCRYNCRVFILNGKILFIRPKIDLANDGNYRERRYFSSWSHPRVVEDHYLSPLLIEATGGQRFVPFGDAALSFNDTVLGVETCEELFTPDSPHIRLGLSGVEIFGNGSGSHHQLRKLGQRISLITSATEKGGGIYLYSNQKGCDGGRLYYDGCCMILCNGQIYAQGSQFSLQEVEVVTATLNVEDVRSYRGSKASRGDQATKVERVPFIHVDFNLCEGGTELSDPLPQANICIPEEEICMGPACWLWDYLRRSKQCGFFLPLSGGADSSSVCAIVGLMCQLVVKESQKGDQQVLKDVRRIVGQADYNPTDPKELAGRLFFTCYMGSKNSSQQTKDRAAKLAKEVGSTHSSVVIDSICDAFINTWVTLTNMKPKFKVEGGTNDENLALQNIQARSRMCLSYLMAQLSMWSQGRSGGVLVLGAANVDESLRGYMTKYDCSAADLNPIGAISKVDLKRFLKWGSVHLGYPSLAEIESAPPTAELEPITATHTQTDEEDMGMTYNELSYFGRIRKIFLSGPVTMYQRLLHEWKNLSPLEVANKVKFFFRCYSINRHKMTTLTPSYHAENYSPDDNRFDHRQFLYNTSWSWQNRCIDKLVVEDEERRKRKHDEVENGTQKKARR